VLAVLAMACFPGLAAAEENSGIQYETDIPTVPDHKSSNIPSKNSDGSNSSNDSGPEATGSNTPGGASPGGGDGTGTGNVAGNGQGNQATGGGDGQGSNGSKPAGGSIGDAQSLQTVNSTAAEPDDGSSPLVPILIAVAVLAAISIGAYYYRQRRQGPGSTVTPPAS
jgi:cobalamin biosynthesis Mg chelatase CobN